MLARARTALGNSWRSFLELPTRSKVRVVATVVGVLAVVVGISLALRFGLAEVFLAWVRQLGVWGNCGGWTLVVLCTHWRRVPAPVAMVAAFLVASWPVIFLFALLTTSSGLLFGLWKGVVVTLVGAVLGGTLAFLLSRFVFRARVEKYVESDAFFLRLNARMEREGWKLALVLRLASMPFGLLNVFFAMTKLQLLPFVLTTLVGEVPVAFIGCFVGSSLGSIGEAAGGHATWSTQKIVLFVVEGVMALSFMVAAILISKKMVQDSMDDTTPLPTAVRTDSDSESDSDGLHEGGTDADARNMYEIEMLPPRRDDVAVDVEAADVPLLAPQPAEAAALQDAPSAGSAGGGGARLRRSVSPEGRGSKSD